MSKAHIFEANTPKLSQKHERLPVLRSHACPDNTQ